MTIRLRERIEKIERDLAIVKADLKSIDGLEAAVSETEELISNHKTVGGIIPLAMVERAAILSAVFHLDGDVIEAARRLQVGKTTLYRKLKEWGMGRTADGLPDP